MKTSKTGVFSLAKKHSIKIDSISDERNNCDGVWIYLTKDYADFNFDPLNPIRTIHVRTPQASRLREHSL